MWQGQKEKVESDFVLAKKSFVVYSFENVSTSTNQFAWMRRSDFLNKFLFLKSEKNVKNDIIIDTANE